MISTVLFLIKTCLIVTALIWLFSLDGGVSITISDYTLNASLGVFVILTLILGWVISVVMRAITVVFDAPNQIVAYRKRKHRAKGLQALAYGLSSVAAGDVRSAKYHTKQLGKYLKEDFGLGALLRALSARLDGDEAETQKSFHALMANKETSFLGLKGLLQGAMARGDKAKALEFAMMAHKENPKQGWVIKTLYDLQIINGQYASAISLLKPAIKYKAIDKDRAKKDKAVLLDASGSLEKALKVDPQSLPLALKILSLWSDGNKRRKSLNLIKKIWALSPHPQLLDYWIKYAPKKAQGNPLAMAAWVENLHHENAKNAASALYCGEALLHMGQGAQANRFIKQSIELKPTMRSFQLMHQLDSVGGWMNHVPMAKQDQAWVCIQTGKIYESWKMITDDGVFNTIEWMYPEEAQSVHHISRDIPSLLAS